MRWCMICTSLMVFTTAINLLYIFQRYFSSGSTVAPTVIANQTAAPLLSSSIDEISLRDLAAPSTDANDTFADTYRTIFDSFVEQMPMEKNNSFHFCPAIPPKLRGPSPIQAPPKNFSLHFRSSFHRLVDFGGSYRPSSCLSRHKVAIIVPYRDRWEILRHFLFHIHRILQRQQLDYRVFVCEQAFDKIFNKGIVMNGCFKEILRLQPDRQCFVMHDVDLLLIDDRNMYSCPAFPRHLSVAIDKFHFYLPYKELVGGVLAMRREHYLLVNGYSTNYWGWGGEDDDMHARIIKKKLILERPPTAIARYKMLKHSHQKLNPGRMKILRTAHIRVDSDGVNNVKYQLLNTTVYHLFTHFLIDVGEQPK